MTSGAGSATSSRSTTPAPAPRSWTTARASPGRFSLGAGASATFSHDTVFSPSGNRIALTKAADAPITTPGGADGYTITATNTTSDPATLNSITEHLPAGFTYVAGSTSGATTANPVQSGQDLTWTGPFPMAVAGTVQLHFGVRAASTVDTYLDTADADAAGRRS